MLTEERFNKSGLALPQACRRKARKSAHRPDAWVHGSILAKSGRQLFCQDHLALFGPRKLRRSNQVYFCLRPLQKVRYGWPLYAVGWEKPVRNAEPNPRQCARDQNVSNLDALEATVPQDRHQTCRWLQLRPRVVPTVDANCHLQHLQLLHQQGIPSRRSPRPHASSQSWRLVHWKAEILNPSCWGTA